MGFLLVLLLWGFAGGSVVKNPPARAADLGLILSWEDLLEKESANLSSIPAWGIPGTAGPGGLWSVDPMGD